MTFALEKMSRALGKACSRGHLPAVRGVHPRSGQIRSGWIIWVLLGALLMGGCATVPREFRERPALGASERRQLNARVFDRVWETVNARYFDAKFRGVDWAASRERYRPEAVAAADEAALYVVLNRMCAELKESHLGALPPRRAHEFQTDHRAAVGIRWQVVEGKRVITDIVPGGPAQRAGIALGWLVVSRDGQPIREGEAVVSKVGRAVRFGFLDLEDRPRDFSLVPELLAFERLEARPLPDGFVYLRFDKFGASSLRWLSRQLKANRNAPGVVIDLRQNSGGNALALNVALAEFFTKRIDEGRMIRRNGSERPARSLSWRSARYGGAVVLLTSQFTASAGEIFSHVLQYHGRAKVVGRRTAGAVVYSRTFSLPDGGTMQVPVMDYIGLNGERLEGQGVVPDTPIPPPSLADLRAGRDAALTAALAILKAGAARGDAQ